MSMEICVFSDRRLNSMSEWQQAIDAESLPLRMSDDKSVAELGGFMATFLGHKRTGFDCRHLSASDVMAAYPEINFGHAWKCGTAFIWGGDVDELQAAWMAAASYAQATGGVVFDEQEGRLLGPAEAIQSIRDVEQSIPDVEAILRNLMERIRTKY